MPAVETHRNALVVPTRAWQSDGGRRQSFDGGVCTEAGEPVRLAQHGHGPNRNETRPARGLPPARLLAGRWLFGGWYRGHFGHLVSESLGRLWATERDGHWDGIVFLRYGEVRRRPAEALTAVRGALPLLQSFLDLLGITLPAVVAEQPVAVEELVVPQALWLTPDEADPEGAKLLRRFLAEATSRTVRATGPLPERIYLSRSRLPPDRAKFILEQAVEENLARAGYAILHPERMSLAEQVMHYRAAHTQIFAEGSAVHMAVPFLGPGKRVGILWRVGQRHPAIHAQLAGAELDALVEFGGFTRFLYSALPGRPGIDEPPAALLRRIQPLPDFDGMGRALEAGGLIPPGVWRSPDEATQGAAVAALLAERQSARPELDHHLVDGSSVPGELGRQRVGNLRDRAAFRRDAALEARRAARKAGRRAAATAADSPFREGLRHTAFIAKLVEELGAQSYFEIGTARGDSVANLACTAICVDPAFKIERDIMGRKPALHLFQLTSDEFFARHSISALLPPPGVLDVAFLDGLHHFEALLRDFANTERHCGPDSVVLLHDCLPQRPICALRRGGNAALLAQDTRRAVPDGGGGWTGDVWKLLPILRQHRPDLRLAVFDCPPSSLVAVTRLDPSSTVLRDRYDDIVAEWMEADRRPGWFDALHDSVTLLPSREHLTAAALRAGLGLTG